MKDRFAAEMRELVELVEDPRTRAEIVEASPRHLLLDLECRGAVLLPDGQIDFVSQHRVRFVGAEGLHGLLTIYVPTEGKRLWHPNVRLEEPFVLCANLESQLERGPYVPLACVLALVYDIIAGAAWAVSEGVFCQEAATWYANAEARGELPFETRTLR